MLVPLPAALGIHITAHSICLEKRRLFICEEYPANAVPELLLCKLVRKFKTRRNAATVIVRAWQTTRSIVMRADDYETLGVFCALALSLNVLKLYSAG